MAVASVQQSRIAGPKSTLLGVAGLGFAWYMLPGVLMLPFMFIWGMERWQYDTIVTWAHVISASIIVTWYTRIIGRKFRSLLANPIGGRTVVSSVATGIVLAGVGELLWGASLVDGITVIALRFDPAVNFGTPVLFIGAVVLTPLVHEAFFRGVLQEHARTSLSAGGAILVSGTAFALLYASLFYIGGATSMVVTILFLFPQGCLFGYLYQHHNTILAPAIAHALVNLYAFSSLLL